MSTVATNQSAEIDASDSFMARLDSELSADEAANGMGQPGSRSTQAAPPADPQVPTEEPPNPAIPSSGTPDAQAPPKPDQPQSPPPDSPPREPSKYEKEQARLNRNRREFEEEKTRERETLRQEREAWERQRRETDKPQFTDEDYSKYAALCEQRAAEKTALAERLEEKGLIEQAEAARAEAQEWSANAVVSSNEAKRLKRETEMRTLRQPQGPQMTIDQAHEHNWRLVAQHMPQFTQRGSVFNRALIDYVKANPQVMDAADGPIVASRTILIQMASRVPELETKIAGLEKRNKELEDATSIAGTTAANRLPSGAKSAPDMSNAELEAQLKEDLAERPVMLM